MAGLPEFKNEDEMFDFFEAHSSVDFMEGGVEVEGPVVDKRPKKQITTIRLDLPLKISLQRIARSKGIRYQTLINMWLTERVREEIRKTAHQAS
jgi:predicted DNA binding CopG/RHH family protein